LKKIQIDTTQNVKVQFEIANIGERALAWLIDFIIISVLTLILGLIFSIRASISQLVMALVLTLYTPLWEALNHGQTPGKMALNLRVIKTNGEPATFLDYLSRWSTKGIEITVCLGSLAALVSFLSKKGQRVGDILADTVVIKNESISRLGISRLLELEKYENYEPKFPEVTQLDETDILLLHETYTRFKKNRNKGHSEALLTLAESVQEKLQVSHNLTAEEFLKQAIKDFVILTR